MKLRIDAVHGKNPKILRAERAERPPQILRVPLPVEIDVGHVGQGVHPGVGAARAGRSRRDPEPIERPGQGSLNGSPIRLHLPARKTGAIVLKVESIPPPHQPRPRP